MLFNSIEFLIFLPIIFILYWKIFNGNINIQNILVLIASYVFYGWWDWRFLFLIAFSTIVDFYCGLKIDKTNNIKRKNLFLGISLTANLGFLLFFKYYNFFIESWVNAWSSFGISTDISTLNIILPVGISFYTFQTLSYTIDIYNKKIQPTNNLIAFSAFVSFFPQLVAGPIERASHLLPQFFTSRQIKQKDLTKGVKLIIWGLFKKVAIADSISPFVNTVYENYSSLPSIYILLGIIFFSFQIYCDFSGYSDIAIGVSRLFGFDLMTNFKFPYFSRDIAEFWRRWHISLSTWFRDYLYIPLGGSKGSQISSLRNIFIIFIVSGFWHGANLTFIIWGFIHAFLFIPLYIFNLNRKHTDNIVASNRYLPSFRESVSILSTFILVSLAWIFFRASSLEEALNIFFSIFQNNELGVNINPVNGIYLILILVSYEWIIRKDGNNVFNHKYKIINYILIALAIWLTIINATNGKQEFIYFQF